VRPVPGGSPPAATLEDGKAAPLIFANAPPGPLVFAFRTGSWDLAEHPRVIGILNVTPDSFFDGGRYDSADRAIERADRMVEEGADGIDVGARSTRPGAPALDLEEEWRRLLPALRALPGRVDVPISVDTFHGEIARRALDLGAAIVNDITGLAHDPSIATLSAAAGAGLVLMHSIGGPERLHEPRPYDDVGASVRGFLAAQLELAVARGVPPERIALDPGVGFSKRPDQSLAALRAIPGLTALGRPLYIGVSRKSFLGALTGRPVEGRLAASLGATVAAFALGGRMFRAHDVRETRDALCAAGALLATGAPPTESRL
jgi:dihydropteroate synthase